MQERVDGIQEGEYVRVIGVLGELDRNRLFKISLLHKLTSCYEIFLHPLEVIFATLYYERGPPGLVKSDNDEQTGSTKPHHLRTLPQTNDSHAPQGGVVTDISDVLDLLSIDPQAIERKAGGSVPDTLATEGSSLPSTSFKSASQSMLVSSTQFPKADPLSYLSSLERAVLLYVRNNEPYHHDGVPVVLVVRAVSDTNAGVIQNVIDKLIGSQHITYTKSGRGLRYLS